MCLTLVGLSIFILQHFLRLLKVGKEAVFISYLFTPAFGIPPVIAVSATTSLVFVVEHSDFCSDAGLRSQ